MAADLLSGTVSHVIDGGTLLLDTDEKIRFAGINSPELDKKGTAFAELSARMADQTRGVSISADPE